MRKKYKITFELLNDGTKEVVVREYFGVLNGWVSQKSFWEICDARNGDLVKQAMDFIKDKIINESDNADWKDKAPIFFDIEGNLI